MFTLLKIGCLAIYAGALAGLAGLLPGALAGTLRNVAIAILVIHVLELGFMFRLVRRYRGPLALSILLTILFGLLHLKPLADERAKEQAGA